MQTITPNAQKLQQLEKNIIQGGLENLTIITDFDGTLSDTQNNGKKIPSLIAILREQNYLSENYSKQAHKLYNHYHKIETDTNIAEKEMDIYMQERRQKHTDLLIKEKLKKDDLKNIIKTKAVQYRDFAKNFIDQTKTKNIPTIIMSASGIGTNSIKYFLQEEQQFYNNIHIVSNHLLRNPDNTLKGLELPIIHSSNKTGNILKKYDFYKNIQNKKNIILIGNNLGDADMANGLNHKNIIKIGFLDEITENKKKAFTEAFDIIFTDNGNFQYPLNLLKQIN